MADVYGALPAATRTGYRLAGWFIGVTNGAPQALEGEAPLRLGPHTLYARWETDWGGETAFAYEAIDATTARITGLKGAAPANGRFGLPDRVDGYLVTEIGARAFQNGTDDFGAVALGVFCTNVADYAFCGATKLTGLAFAAPRRAAAPSESATLALGDYAFASTGLTRVVIPACVSHLGAGAFGSCRALDEVSVLGTPALGADNVFRRAGIDTPDGKMTLRAAPAWISANGLDAKGNLVPAALTPAVESVRATAISGAGRVWTLTFDVRLAAGGDWAAFDAHTMRLEYAPSPSGAWAALVPAALDARAAGVVKLTVVLPEEKPSGFFRVVFGE